MTVIVLIALLVAGQVGASYVELDCSDNAVCIDRMMKEFVKSVREGKTVKLFDLLTVEPVPGVEGRGKQGLLSRFFSNHAFSFDWSDLSFRLSRPQHRSDALSVEVFQGRSTDVKETTPKKTTSKVEEEEDDKSSKRLRRRQKKKVLQALIPMLFGMKSAGTVILAFVVVTALTMKAFMASKLALVVTVGMAMKRLYDNYSNGVGLQNHPYLYSQYPIDFPSASSHAYSVSGLNPQFGSADVYNNAALATHSHSHEILQQADATAQQSQAAPTVQLANATRATERWDGIRQRPMFYGPSRTTSESFSGYQDYRH